MAGTFTTKISLWLSFAPAFAWLYKMGQTQFGPKGDQLFADAAVNGFFGSGKQFSQLYHWSFDYVRWRR